MNDKIKELIEKSGAGDVVPKGMHNYLKKFAELIVKECASVARTVDLEDVDGGDSAVLRAAANQIAKHFGVE